MALPVVTQQDLLNKRAEEDAWDIVLFGGEGCGACAQMEELVEGIKDNYPTITFSRLNVTAEDLPLFAPPVIPSLLALHNGVRIWEALGTISNLDSFDDTITRWLNNQVNFDMISGGTVLHEFS